MKNVNLYDLVGGKVSYENFAGIDPDKHAISFADRPYTADIHSSFLRIHFLKHEYSYDRRYDIEKVYPSRSSNEKNIETLDHHAYKLTFNNPKKHDSPESFYISLTWKQDVIFTLFRLFRWMKAKDNLIWIINIIVLLLNVLGFFMNKCPR